MKTTFYSTTRVVPFVLSMFALAFLIPLVTFAQIPETGVGVGGVVTCSGSACDFCDLVQTGNLILNWVFGMVFIVFAVLVFISGFKMVAGGISGNYNSLGDTKKTLTNAVIGIVVIFSAWLIVDTLMKGIASGGNLGSVGMWNEIDCGSQVTPNKDKPLADQTGTGGVVPVTASQGCTDIGNGQERCTRTIYGATPPPAGYTCTPSQVSLNGDRQDCVLIRPLGGGTGEVVDAGGTGGGLPDAISCTPNQGGTTETCLFSSDEDVTSGSVECVRTPLIGYTCRTTRPRIASGSGPGGSYTEAEALAALQAAGIGVRSSGGCNDPTRRTCTGLTGLQPSTVSNLVAVNAGCPSCNIAMTAGTEVGHSNSCHRAGTCADVACSSSGGDSRACTLSEIMQINQAATSNGARPIYETMSCDLRDRARANGITAYCSSDPDYGHISADHFSIYPGN